MSYAHPDSDWRRRCRRVRLPAGETIMVTIEQDGLATPLQAKLRDLSVLGLAVQLPRGKRLARHTEQVFLRFHLPGIEEPQGFAASVRHKSRTAGLFVVGFEFEPKGQDPRTLFSTPLGRFVQTLLDNKLDPNETRGSE